MLLDLVWLHKHRYYWNSEVMHVLLNITKTIWAVCFGVPRLGPFLTPGRRLAIAWKCGLDCLMVSGLGELVSSTSAALHGPNRLPKYSLGLAPRVDVTDKHSISLKCCISIFVHFSKSATT